MDVTASVDITGELPGQPPPTDEQRAILAHPPRSTLLVEAAAGSGKTDTLIRYARKWKDHRGLYIAFGREIAAEATWRLPPNVTSRTAHSYAYRARGVAQHKARLVRRLRRSDLRQAGVDLRSDYLPPDRMARAILDGISNFCIDAGNEFLPRHCGLENSPAVVQTRVLPQIAAVVKRFLNYEDSGLAFSHDVYLKRMEMEGRLGDVADYLLLDEAQDLNPVLVSLVRKSGLPAIVVGDAKQAIYAFRGAINAFDAFDAPRLPLSQSWRFGPEVAELANHIFTYSDAPMRHPVRGRPDRTTRIGLYGGKAPARSFILARTNSRLFEGLVRLDVPFHVAGGFDVLASQLVSAWSLSINNQYAVTDAFVRAFPTWDAFVDEAGQEDPDAKRLVKIVKEWGSRIPEIVERLRTLQRDSPQDARIILSTAHRAKGLEADNVIICDDFETPDEMRAKLVGEKMSQVQYEQELNLLYVGISRARFDLMLPPALHQWWLDTRNGAAPGATAATAATTTVQAEAGA